MFRQSTIFSNNKVMVSEHGHTMFVLIMSRFMNSYHGKPGTCMVLTCASSSPILCIRLYIHLSIWLTHFYPLPYLCTLKKIKQRWSEKKTYNSALSVFFWNTYFEENFPNHFIKETEGCLTLNSKVKIHLKDKGLFKYHINTNLNE